MQYIVRRYLVIVLSILMFSFTIQASPIHLMYGGQVYEYNLPPISLFIDEVEIKTVAMPPIQLDNSVLVPIREVFSSLPRCTVTWNGREKKVYIDYDEHLLVLEIDSELAWLDGETKEVPLAPKLINNKVMVPIRFISETVGYTVIWSNETRNVNIYTNNGLSENDKLDGEYNEQEDPSSNIENEKIVYDTMNQSLSLPYKDNINIENISLEEDYKSRKLIINLNEDYRDVLEEFNKSTILNKHSEIKDISINYEIENTQLIISTETVKTALIDMKEDKLIIKLVSPNQKYDRIILIDAGHGKHDAGASYGQLKEKNLTLALGNAVIDKLRQDSQFKVYATREDDTFLELGERVQLSNEINPDLFISIHINAAGNTSASGTETYYTPKEDIRNKIFASIVQKELVQEFGTRDRKVKANTFVVTNKTEAPAILIEIGFLSNEKDRALMLQDGFKERYAEALYNSILEYYNSGYDY